MLLLEQEIKSFCVGVVSGHLASDGIMWFQMPFKHWHVFYTPITCLLASVFLCSEILENNIGISSEFLRGISLLLSFCVKVILRDFEDPKYTQGSQGQQYLVILLFSVDIYSIQ